MATIQYLNSLSESDKDKVLTGPLVNLEKEALVYAHVLTKAQAESAYPDVSQNLNSDLVLAQKLQAEEFANIGANSCDTDQCLAELIAQYDYYEG